jgi:CRISPR-associated endonuclease/helicase Cas3
MGMKYIGHRNQETGEEQSLRDHLLGTAKLAGEFAEAFDESAFSKLIGRYHDIGKYSNDFQIYIRNGGGKKVDHSTAGMQEFFKNRMLEAAFCVGGHHAGLPNGGTCSDGASGNTLWAKNKRDHLPDYQAYVNENEPITSVRRSSLYQNICREKDQFSWMFYTRMLFSCLVDADFLDTEEFMNSANDNRKGFASIETLKKRLDDYIEKNLSKPVSAINKKRCEILTQCVAAGDELQEEIKNLTVPTGGGKTIASLAFALHAAEKQQKKRVIYVIPYTTIIEQTAQVFGQIMGSENVVEHHMNVEYDTVEDNETTEFACKRLAVENWDAPIIVTTNVQFFESLFANRTSRSRKLHHIANSIIIFDEAQMIPTGFLRPCTRAIEELTLHYHCIAVLCTATQPALKPFFKRQEITEICRDVTGNYDFFQRTKIEPPGDIFEMEDLAKKIAVHEQVLCIVNTKKSAGDLFDLVNSKSNEGVYYLSTNLYPVHRIQVLKEIKKRLKDGQACRVIATSLVEAGVDIDFPVVYRELAGLDSLLQAAGRCNREGKRSKKLSVVQIFLLPDTKRNKHMRLSREAAEKVLRDSSVNIDSPQAIQHYFEILYKFKGEGFLDHKNILAMSEKPTMPFHDIAKEFVLIEERQMPIYIPTEENIEITSQIESGKYTRLLLRKAGKYMVNVYCGDKNQPYEKLHAAQKIIRLDDALTILADRSLYDKDKGLAQNIEEGQGVFM